MLSNCTVSKLHEMKLSVMATSFQKQLDENAVASLSFEEDFGLLVDAAWTSRKNNRLKRLNLQGRLRFPRHLSGKYRVTCGPAIEQGYNRLTRHLWMR